MAVLYDPLVDTAADSSSSHGATGGFRGDVTARVLMYDLSTVVDELDNALHDLRRKISLRAGAGMQIVPYRRYLS